MGGYTPGPWFISHSGMGIHKYIEARIGGGLVQEVACCGPTEKPEWSEANARLIAAAPELLGECRGLYAVFLHHQCPRCGIAWSEDECQDMVIARRAGCLCGYEQELKGAAISRATGEDGK